MWGPTAETQRYGLPQKGAEERRRFDKGWMLSFSPQRSGVAAAVMRKECRGSWLPRSGSGPIAIRLRTVHLLQTVPCFDRLGLCRSGLPRQEVAHEIDVASVRYRSEALRGLSEANVLRDYIPIRELDAVLEL